MEQSYASVAVVVTCMDDMVAGRVPLKQQACLDEPSSAVVVVAVVAMLDLVE